MEADDTNAPGTLSEEPFSAECFIPSNMFWNDSKQHTSCKEYNCIKSHIN